MMGHMFGYGFPGNFNWWWIAGFGILRLLIFVGLVIFIIKLIGKQKSNTTNSRALEILNERYAQGEINEEEYVHKKKILKQ